MTKYDLLFALVGSVGVMFLIVAITPSPSSAQSPLQWAPPQRIRGISDDANPPYLVADQNHTVHAFYSQWTGGELAVFYDKWTLTSGWTAPVDVLLSSNKGQATVLGAFLDSKGMFHVIFYGGIAEGAEIYYSSAPAVNAGQARAWSPPKLIGDRATAPASGFLVGDDKGNLFVVYAGNRDGSGVYEVHSADGGTSWSDPISIFLTQSSVQLPYGLKMYLDELGWLHAIWNVVDKNGQGRGIYYARLNIRNKQWSFPTSLAETPNGIGANDPSITEHRGILIAAFYDADMGGHYVMRTSSDDGQTWADPTVPFPQHIGANGAGSFVVDGNDALHMFWGQRITANPDIHGMWESMWVGGHQWSVPVPVVSGPLTSQFDPSLARAVVSQGNVLLVTWRQDPGLAGNGVWYSFAILVAPELPVLALPTPSATRTVMPTLVVTSTSVTPPLSRPTRQVLSPRNTESPPSLLDGNPTVTILVAALPVIVLLMAVAVIRNPRGSA